MPASRAKSTFGTTPVSSNTISAGVDSQSARGLDARHAAVVPSQGKDPGPDGEFDAESLQFVFDDLGHVPIDARQDLRLLSNKCTFLPSACRHSATSSPTYPAPMIATLLGFGKRFVDANRILKIDQSEHVFQIRAGNIRKSRLDAGGNQQPVVGELDAFARIRSRSEHAFARGNNFFHASVVVNLDTAFFFEGLRSVGNEVLCGDHLRQVVRNAARAVGNVGLFSRTVTFSRGSMRFARDAAVRPAALPPMMRIFSTRGTAPALDPGVRIALAAFARSGYDPLSCENSHPEDRRQFTISGTRSP